MNKSLRELYERHHEEGNRENFAIYQEQRGRWFARKIGRDKRVLDLGCRDGVLSKYYTRGNDVVGVDIDKRLLQKAKKRLKIQTVHMNLYDSWSFQGKFDVIVAGEILEHLYYPERIIERAERWLKPKGILLVSVPNAYIISARVRFVFGHEIPAHGDPTHINLFSERKLKTILEKHFKKVEVTGIAPPVYKPFHFISNSLFADDLLAYAIK